MLFGMIINFRKAITVADKLKEILKAEFLKSKYMLSNPDELIDFLYTNAPKDEMLEANLLIGVLQMDSNFGKEMLACANDIPAKRSERFEEIRQKLISKGIQENGVIQSIEILAYALSMNVSYGKGKYVTINECRYRITELERQLVVMQGENGHMKKQLSAYKERFSTVQSIEEDFDDIKKRHQDEILTYKTKFNQLVNEQNELKTHFREEVEKNVKMKLKIENMTDEYSKKIKRLMEENNRLKEKENTLNKLLDERKQFIKEINDLNIEKKSLKLQLTNNRPIKREKINVDEKSEFVKQLMTYSKHDKKWFSQLSNALKARITKNRNNIDELFLDSMRFDIGKNLLAVADKEIAEREKEFSKAYQTIIANYGEKEADYIMQLYAMTLDYTDCLKVKKRRKK